MAVIMVVEDNPTNLKLVRMVLERSGYEVREASGAEEAIAAIQGELPDLVLGDVQLPGMDGFEAMRLIKNTPLTAKLPVVALPAFAMRGDEERIMASGFGAYLAKPGRYPALLQTIARSISPLTCLV